MGRFRNTTTNVVVSVDDSKDDRFGEGWEALDGSESIDTGYKGQKVADLRAEIAKRNKGRGDADLLSDEGNKAELIATLEADDNK
jgi:hypothetical protein